MKKLPKNEEAVSDAVVDATAPGPQVIKMKAVHQELSNALIAYLDTRPHNEVRNLIDSLSQSPLVDVTFN